MTASDRTRTTSDVWTREEFEQFYRVTAETFPDQQMTLDTLVAEGDRVAS